MYTQSKNMKTPSVQSPLLSSLHKRATHAKRKLAVRHPHTTHWLHKAAAGSALAGALLLGQPVGAKLLETPGQHIALAPQNTPERLKESLLALLPTSVESLTQNQEKSVSALIKSIYGIDAYAVLEGERLNHSYGYIGKEQHLPRYPGDTVAEHDEPRREGITPGRGAWGYFAPSREELTEDMIQKEKWYVAVQTLYTPDWNTRTAHLRDWYKYRKVLVLNPVNGTAVVANIADAGPAKWTGKHFGGSPELMAYMNLKDGKQKGAVVLFFVDDPLNEIPLGPVEQNIYRGGAL